MNSWEKRADEFHFRHRTFTNDNKVKFITNNAFQLNKPIELNDNESYIKIGNNWRFKQVEMNMVLQFSPDGDNNWTDKRTLSAV